MVAEWKIGDARGQLESAKGGYHICPNCGEPKLSIHKEGEKFDCYGCNDTKAIWRALAPKQELSNLLPGSRPVKRVKSEKEKDRDAHNKTQALDTKLDELVWLIEGGAETRASAQSYLWNWCGEHGQDKIAAKQDLDNRLKILQEINDNKEGKTAPTELPSDRLKQRLKWLIAEGITSSDVTQEIPQLAAQAGWHTSDVRRLYESLQREQNQADALASANITDLIALSRQELNLHEYFPAPLARALHSKAESDRLAPARPMQSLLAASASQLGSRLEIQLKGQGENAWTEFPILWTLDIGKASMGKTQCDRTITAPLRKWQREENRKQKAAIEALPEVERKWKSLDANERAELEHTDTNPAVYQKEHIQARKFIFYRGTTESLLSRISEQPARAGLVWLPGEISSLLRDADKYYKGSSSENILLDRSDSPFDEPMERRSSGNTLYYDQQIICISGGTQPERVTDLLDPQNDPSGMASRWLVVMPKIPDNFAIWSETNVDSYGCLSALYNGLRNLNTGNDVLRCSIDAGAKRLFVKQWEWYRQQQIELDHENAGLSKYFGKCPGHLGRLALVLHAIEVVYGQATLGIITEATMKRAVNLLDYYIGQFRLMQIYCSVGTNHQKLTGKLLNLRDYIKRKDGLTTADMTRGGKGKKAELIPLLNALIEQGHITECEGKYYAVDHTQQPTQQSETVAIPKPEKSEAPSGTPSEPIAIDTPVEVSYPSGETPPPEAPPPGTRGTVTSIDGESITILMSGISDRPLGQRFKTVLRSYIQPLTLIG